MKAATKKINGLKPGTIKRLSVVDQIYEAMKQNLLEHVWNPGDKLPSEGELAEFFGVNRLSVRMALQKLSALGMIETKVGEGSFVAPFSLKQYFDEVAPLLNTEERRRDVEQLRNLLEGECINIAIKSATDEQKASLKRRLDDSIRWAEEYDKDPENLEMLEKTVAADFAFHYEIIRMSGNHLYMDIYRMVQQVITDHIKHLIYTRAQKFRLEDLQEYSHETIYNCIVNGDVEMAKKTSEVMLGILPYRTDYYEDPDSDVK